MESNPLIAAILPIITVFGAAICVLLFMVWKMPKVARKIINYVKRHCKYGGISAVVFGVALWLTPVEYFFFYVLFFCLTVINALKFAFFCTFDSEAMNRFLESAQGKADR